MNTLELFAGPGGWDEGARLVAPRVLGITGYDLSNDACLTAAAAGHRRIKEDVRTLDPSDFPDVTGAIMSPPCPTFSDGGLRSGLRDYQKVLDVWTSIGWGIDVRDALTSLEDVEDPRTSLLALAGVWALSLPNITWLAMEQVPKAEFAWEDLAAELYAIGWEWADVHTFEASDYGLPSRRRRSFLVAKKTRPGGGLALEPGRTSMAKALGWRPGHRINTRGQRTSGGGNWFNADSPSWCLTGSTRSWRRDDGLQLTAGEAGTLMGFRPDYPWTGSRTSQFLQIADAVPPPIAAAVLATVIETSESCVGITPDVDHQILVRSEDDRFPALPLLRR